IAANSFNASDYYTKTQSDSRYFVSNANAGNISLIRDAVTPPTLRVLIPRSPLNINVILSGTALELTCDAYTRSEADGRYVRTGDLSSLDSRYFPVNGNNGGGGIFPMLITTLTPRMIRAILPRPPLSGAFILGNAATLELNCDCYSKSESDSRYYTKGQSDAAFAPLADAQNNASDITALDARVTALEGSTSLTASSFVSTPEVRAPADWLSLRSGTAGTRIRDSTGTTDWMTVTSSEAFFGVRARVDHRITIDTPSGPDEGLHTAAVRARTGDPYLTLTGGTSGVEVDGPLTCNGLVEGASAVFPTSVATADLMPSPSTNPFMRIIGGTTGTRIYDQSLNALLSVEDDETQSTSRLISVTRAATGNTVGAVLKNTAGTGWARLQLDANGSTGFAQLEVGSTGDCMLYAPNQAIRLHTVTSGSANLVIEPNTGGSNNGEVIANYGFQNLSDYRVKTDIEEADADELAECFEALQPKWYKRIEAPGKQKLGFIAQEVQAAGKVGEALCGSMTDGDQEFVTLDYSRLCCVLWGAVKCPRQIGPNPGELAVRISIGSAGRAGPLPPTFWAYESRTDVSQDCGVGLGIDVKRSDFPTQLLEDRPPNLVEPCVAAMDLRLGDVDTNQKGGKFLPAEPLCWNMTQWAEILYELGLAKVVDRLEKQASAQIAAKKLDSKLQTCIKQTRNERRRKALVAIDVRQLWIMGQMCGLLLE
ncbi:unnamed protein product, partial [Symbiodinium necroappetens]